MRDLCPFHFLGDLCHRKETPLVGPGIIQGTPAEWGAVPCCGLITQEGMNPVWKARQQTQTLRRLLTSQTQHLLVGGPQAPPSLLPPSPALRQLGLARRQ